MKQANIDFLEKNIHHWHTVRDAEYVKHLNAGEREGMMRIMAEEFRPGYTTDLWCGSCLFDMVRTLYTNYEAWKAAQPVVIQSEPLVVAASFPAVDKPKNHKRK